MFSHPEKYNQYWDWHQNLYTSLAQSQYQTPLQPSPDAATPQRSNAMESTLYTSKNPSFYPCKNDGENAEDIRSAFKPIKRKLPRLPLNAAQSLYHSETSYYNNPNATAGLPSNSFYQYPQAPVHPPNGESYNLSHAMASNNNLRSGPKPAIWSPAANIESSSKPVDVFDPRNAVDAIPNNPTMISETDFYKSMPSAITRCRPISHSSPVGTVYQWETLLPIVPEPPVTKSTSNSRKSSNPKQRRRKSNPLNNRLSNSRDESVPIIDLTSSDDIQIEQKQQLNRTETAVQSAQMPNIYNFIESKRSPTLDADGNEILIRTDTESTQAKKYKKQKQIPTTELHNLLTNTNINATATATTTTTATATDTDLNVGKTFDSYSSNEFESVTNTDTMTNTNTKTNTNATITTTTLTGMGPKTQMENFTAFNTDFRYNNGIRMPPKKQVQLMAKYNKFQLQLRAYNGFRLFARRNQMYAQKHTPETKNEAIIYNILLKWWNSISPNEKEHYASVAEIIRESRARPTSSSASASTSTSASAMSGSNDDNNRHLNDVNTIPDSLASFTSVSKCDNIPDSIAANESILEKLMKSQTNGSGNNNNTNSNNNNTSHATPAIKITITTDNGECINEPLALNLQTHSE